MKKFALAGNPNCGKTTLFNALTGSTAYVGNWPGVTVDKREGTYKKLDEPIDIVDLPGIYSLSPYTPEEVISRNFILDERPDCVVNIVDATNIERNLYLTTQLMEIDVPMIVALNMMDAVEKNGDVIDAKKLEEKLGLPVVAISALKGKGLHELMKRALAVSRTRREGSTVLSGTSLMHLIGDVRIALEGKGVGAPLFHRGKGLRRITLTDAGQHFLPLARRWQNLLAETQTFAAAEKREFLHVIAAYTANQYILPPVYQRFLERELPVNLWVESMRTDQAVSAVARGDADMAIVDGSLHYDLQIEAKPLFREGFFLVVPKTVALTEPVEATTLHVQDEILIYGQPEILQWHDYWFGVDARPLLYADTPQLAETLPACGKRWSIIPAGATEPYLRMFSNVQVLHLAHPPAERTFYLVTPKGRALSAAAETLLDDLRTQIQHVGGITWY